MQKVKDIAAQNDVSRIELDVWSSNESAKSFFRRAGFVLFNEHMYLQHLTKEHRR